MGRRRNGKADIFAGHFEGPPNKGLDSFAALDTNKYNKVIPCVPPKELPGEIRFNLDPRKAPGFDSRH